MDVSLHRAWLHQQHWFTTNQAEWGGTQLLLRVVPAGLGHPFDHPPFDQTKVEFVTRFREDAWVRVLRVGGHEYYERHPNGPTFGHVADGDCPSGAARWWAIWYGTRAGWDRFLHRAGEAGRLLSQCPPAIHDGLRLPLLDPMTTNEDTVRWILAMFSHRAGSFAPHAPVPYQTIVDADFGWHQVPINRGERERLALRYPGVVANTLARDPLDNFVMLLTPEVYTAAAATCATVAWLRKPNYNWKPMTEGPPGEAHSRRHARLLDYLLSAREANPPMGITPWRNIPGARQSDFAYLTGAKLVEGGYRTDLQGVSGFADPEFLDVWLTLDGVEVALDAREQERPAGAPGMFAPSEWRDETKAANERVLAYMLHLALNGVRTRPRCRSIAQATGLPEPTIRNTSAWKSWPKVDLPGGGLADQHRADRGRDSARAARDRIDQNGDAERD